MHGRIYSWKRKYRYGGPAHAADSNRSVWRTVLFASFDEAFVVPYNAVWLGGCAISTIYLQVLAEVQALNEREDIDGIVVQMPLPTGVDSAKVRHH